MKMIMKPVPSPSSSWAAATTLCPLKDAGIPGKKCSRAFFETCVLRYFSATLIMLPTSAAVISDGCSPGVWPGAVQPLGKPRAIPLGLPFLTLRTNWGFLRKRSSATRGLSLQWWFSFPAGEEDGWFIMGVYFKTTSNTSADTNVGFFAALTQPNLGCGVCGPSPNGKDQFFPACSDRQGSLARHACIFPVLVWADVQPPAVCWQSHYSVIMGLVFPISQNQIREG